MRRIIQFSSVIIIAGVGMLQKPATAQAANLCYTCEQTCPMDIYGWCAAKGCETNFPTCHESQECFSEAGYSHRFLANCLAF